MSWPSSYFQDVTNIEVYLPGENFDRIERLADAVEAHLVYLYVFFLIII